VEKKLMGAKVKYRNPIKYLGCLPQDNHLYSKHVSHMIYPIGFMTGNWFEINKVSGDYFDFKGSSRKEIIPFTTKLFPKSDWEWDFSNAT
jgi:hypothetical protein